MKKYRLKKGVKMVLLIGLLIASSILIIGAINRHREEAEREQKELVNNYIECLKANNTQRFYCASVVSNTDYRILDQLIKKYGYDYVQIKKDLYIIEK